MSQSPGGLLNIAVERGYDAWETAHITALQDHLEAIRDAIEREGAKGG